MKQSLRLYETYHYTAIPEKELFLLTAEDLKDMHFFYGREKEADWIRSPSRQRRETFMAESGILKILFVLDILRRTDEFHPVNSTQIIKALEKEGFKAERKAVGNYIRALTDEMGYDIVLCDNRNLGWYMRGQEFEDYELKMLVDAIASAKFLTAAQSRELIKKIRGLATREGNRIIGAGLVMDESLKLVDNKFAFKFDAVMRAIADHRQIRFQYEEYRAGNQKKVKKDGWIYQISPYYLGVWGHEYFVVANTAPYHNTSHYRIALMKDIEVTSEAVRPMADVEGLKEIGKGGRTFGDYIKEMVNLGTGPVTEIKLSGINKLRPEVMKKFGNRLFFRDLGEDWFTVYVKAAISEGFYQWIAQFGNNLRIEGPPECIDGIAAFLEKALGQYRDGE